MSSSAPHDWIGQKLADRYHVTEKIGAGGVETSGWLISMCCWMIMKSHMR